MPASPKRAETTNVPASPKRAEHKYKCAEAREGGPGAPWAVLGAMVATVVFALVAAIAAQEPPRKQPARPEASAASTTTRANQQPPADGQQSQHRKLFAPVDLGLLEAPDRDAWQRPDRVMDALGIADGSIVGDLGAGGGWFTIRLARRVGPNGIVYAEDVQPQMIEAIDRRVRREGWRNVHVVLGTPRNPGFPADKLDAILIVEAYHEMEDPVTLLRNAARGLKPQGRIGVIDYKKDGFGPGPPVEDRVDPELIERDAQEAGLRVVARETFLPFQFFVILGRQ
ncbi:MAG: class I SAM-dependent methyltransferase [Bacteroidales bacterium]